MDRLRFPKATQKSLNPEGHCLIVQNNRYFQGGGFASAYEELLEQYPPGYSRHYRDINIVDELKTVFSEVGEFSETWTRLLSVDEFVSISASSTQAQRAVSAVGEVFFENVRELCEEYVWDGKVSLDYESQAFLGFKVHE